MTPPPLRWSDPDVDVLMGWSCAAGALSVALVQWRWPDAAGITLVAVLGACALRVRRGLRRGGGV